MHSQDKRKSSQMRQQLRGFVAVWLSLTLLIGVATFVGIYVGTGEAATASNDSEVVIAQPQNNENANTDSNVNTDVIADTANPSENIVDENPVSNTSTNNVVDTSNNAPPQQEGGMPTPTIPPNQETRFDLGIQLTPAFANDRGRMSGYMDAAANQLRLNWVKLQVRWEFAEPQRGIYDWERLGYDLFFELAAETNTKVLVSVVSTPEWAREPGADLTEHGPPANNQDFANFIGALISRYPQQIHAVEVWNEMNLAREWTSPQGLSAFNYVQMLSSVHDVIRFLDPNIMIISGALSPTGVNDGVIAIDDFLFTDQLIAAGVLNYIDCYGAHHNGINIGPNVPYDRVPNDPTAQYRGPYDNPHHSWSFYSTLNTYANKIAAAGSTIPLCVTEFGWAVTEDLDLSSVGGTIPGFGFANDNTLAEQSQYLVEAIQLMEQWGFVRLAMIWNLNFGAEANWDISREYRDNIPYSLIRPGYAQAQPAWNTIAEMDFRGRP